MITEIKGNCQFENCDQPATDIAAGRKSYDDKGHPGVKVYCDYHAGVVEDEQSPEYTECCPNCGCRFGVN